MENSFFVVPKDDSDSPAAFSMIIKRVEMINNICEGVENRYKSEYPHIVKLCRLCIADICKELTDRINFETKRFKKYCKVRDQLVAGNYFHPNKDSLIEELNVNSTDAKYLYNQYRTLFQELKQKKLYTKACIICAETKGA